VQWQTIADDYMNRMGFTDKHQRCYVLHDLPNGQHIHLLANRIGIDGTVFLGQNENLESTRIITQLEKDYGLTITKGPSLDEDGKVIMPDAAAITNREFEQAARTGDEPARMQLQHAIDAALDDGKLTAPQFVERLRAVGVQIRTNIASTGKLNGFSFGASGVFFRGSQLGKAYTWARLQARGVSYDVERDAQALRASEAPQKRAVALVTPFTMSAPAPTGRVAVKEKSRGKALPVAVVSFLSEQMQRIRRRLFPRRHEVPDSEQVRKKKLAVEQSPDLIKELRDRISALRRKMRIDENTDSLRTAVDHRRMKINKEDKEKELRLEKKESHAPTPK
jgi:hypothetical protein